MDRLKSIPNQGLHGGIVTNKIHLNNGLSKYPCVRMSNEAYLLGPFPVSFIIQTHPQHSKARGMCIHPVQKFAFILKGGTALNL